jgi:NAD(P)-dependent dehydrogenase (short-subunit alcohol dehydrogenase family)
MAPRGVQVNVICPGFIRTAMTSVNRFRMPLLMDADRAAAIIHHGLAADRPRIAFPLPIYVLVLLLSLLPLRLTNWLTAGIPRKPAIG